MSESKLKELINRRRRQILVHSYLYYRRDTNIIDDTTYDLWGKELAELQYKHPEVASDCVYEYEFRNYDGASGFDLPLGNPHVIDTAEKLLAYNNKL